MTPSTAGPFESIRGLVESCRLRNENAINDVVARVRRGEYAIILGPRFSEKTFLLDDVASELRKWQIIPLAVDLETLQLSDGLPFIGRLSAAVAAAIVAAGVHVSTLESTLTTERDLQQFLQSIPGALQHKVALLFDHLEILPVDNIVALLRVLRAMLNETQAVAADSICAVATSTFAVADISLGPVSPFNVAPPVFVEDLGPEETGRLVDRFAKELGISLGGMFRDRIYDQTSGDRYAIARLCHRCAERARAEERTVVTPDDVADATDWFLKNAEDYPPLQETRRSLEHDPTSLLALTAILARGALRARELPIAIAHPDHLRLTGAVQTRFTPEGTEYRPRNDLYRQYLSRYYHAARVSRVLFVAGWFDEAVAYLLRQPNLKTDRRTREAFLDSITGSIFAARSVEVAIGNLAHHIHSAFGVTAVAVYVVTSDRGALRLISSSGAVTAINEFRLDADSLEKEAYFSEHYALNAEECRIAVPLRDGPNDPSGVVVATGVCAPRDREFAELYAFIRRAGKALGLVADRERRVDQLQRLQTITREVARFVDFRQVMRKTVEEGIKAIDGAQRGVLLLYGDSDKKLRVGEQRGYRDRFADEMIVDPAGTSYTARVFQTGEPALIKDAQNDLRVTMRNDVDIAKQRSALCVQLSSLGRRIGVFCVDNITTTNAFRESSADLLAAFAAQAAIAIRNAVVYRELYELSLAINGTNLHAADIFHRVVRSIVRVTGADAANMLLLHNTDDPARALAQASEVYAYGMGDRFEKAFRPRPDGITLHVLNTRRHVIVSATDRGLTINPLSREQHVEVTLALPLLITNVILGVLYVNFTAAHDFSPEEIDILAFYANECAVAIERVRHEERRIHASVAWMGLDLSEMGHDITQGVSRLQANLYMLSSRVEPGSEAATLVEGAREAADAIANVPRQALAAGIEHVESFDLVPLIREEGQRWCSTNTQISLDLRGLEGASAIVAADPRRVAKVVKTLMQNAVRAAKSSEERSIRIAAAVHSRTVEITFTNTGTPIAPEVAARLFREPVGSSEGGQGVGLLIASAIVFGYAGELVLLSSDETGTIFQLSLPIAHEALWEATS